ncbi:uncharacterized protein F5Z01DRAFT_487176 [Emericellopsis atlantica]|uniref:Uncharacterized protein n=1 Tax=Emericellopsis atlantica TaxID=2614577 RepID=A0A9P7ZS04_9HYPO|nr:uncharacterized protein F5Z01DRAFT_487176 [Emericellopsis atlantica]KAG9256746.1 hypothetical protein F5Z01DRAFT_487176 [Emericellopsis atlantica]
MSAASPQPMFQCGLCKRSYKRLDYLSRHARSHSQWKPHRCHICSKSFTRTDLLKRHVAGHDSPNARSKTSNTVAGPAEPSGRVAQACKACASNHLRCTDEKPCKRCLEKGVDCIWKDSMDVDQDSMPAEAEGQFGDDCRPAPDSELDPETELRSEPGTELEAETEKEQEAEQKSGPPQGQQSLELVQPYTPISLEDTVRPQYMSSESHSDFSGYLIDPNCLPPPGPFLDGFPALGLLSAQWPQNDDMDLDLGPRADLDDQDVRFLESYNITVPFDFGDDSSMLFQTQPPSHVSTDPGQPASVCAEAFQNSHWHFRPNSGDFCGAEDHNLSLPDSAADASPESRVAVKSRVLRSKLDVSTRDKILTMVMKNANPINLPKAIVSFPSVELLDMLMQFYLASPISKATSFLHAAAFDHKEKRPELLAAMAANGAVLTSDSALTKLGYAIAECVRVAISNQWESDNTLVRDLQLSQAFLIILEMGLWSGHSRKVELAESFFLPLLTMLRRNDKFKRAPYLETTTQAAHDASTHQQWMGWVESESFKRLALRMLLHDSNSSMALLTNPLISYTEVQLPLPAPTELWTAESAERWQLAMHRTNSQDLSIFDLLDDPSYLNKHRDAIDFDIAGGSVLSLVWMLAWELTRITTLQKQRPRRFNALIIMSRLDELLKLLGSLRITLQPDMASSPELAMRFEIIHLHLHMPFEDIETFAGKHGIDQARTVYPSVREWAKSESARRAMHHAGRIIRASRLLAKGLIQGPEAIMVYYASLAFWVYGLLLERPLGGGLSDNGAPSVPRSTEDVYLDGDDDAAISSFIEFEAGRPCIRWCDADDGDARSLHGVYLDNPAMTLEVVIQTIERNFQGAQMAHLPSKLIKLVRELIKTS